MFVCDHLPSLKLIHEPLHLALGVFDGVHLGHQEVIARAVSAAHEQGGMAGLLTFNPHPLRVLAPTKAPSSILATLEHQQDVVSKLGISAFFPLRFDTTFAAMEASDFLSQLCQADIRTLAVGEDWRFGKQRAGDVTLLRNHAVEYGYQLEAVSPVMFDGDRISSTRIRQAIHDGNLREAALMLGRRYSISGTVQKGQQLGRTIGFPTANLDVADVQLPPLGVWAVTTVLPNGERVQAVANLGTRPTLQQQTPLLEVHLLDWKGELYDTYIDVEFIEFIRKEQAFTSLEALRAQIHLDAKLAKNIHATT